MTTGAGVTFKRKLIVVGDHIMVRPEEGKGRTRSGLYLPATVLDRDVVMAGWVVEVGPGIALPDPVDMDDEEPWRRRERRARYLPPQATEGDYAIFLRKAAVEITYEDEKYLIVPNGALLALIREDLASGTTSETP